MDRKNQQKEEGPMSGTKKRCSHNLHGGERIIAEEASRQRK